MHTQITYLKIVRGSIIFCKKGEGEGGGRAKKGEGGQRRDMDGKALQN